MSRRMFAATRFQPAVEIAMGTPMKRPAIIMQQLRKSVYATEYRPRRAVTTMTPKAMRVPIFFGTPRMEFRMSPHALVLVCDDPDVGEHDDDCGENAGKAAVDPR